MKKRVFQILVASLVIFAASAFAVPSNEVFVLDLNNPDTRAAIEKAGATITNEGPGGTPAVRFTVTPDAFRRQHLVQFPMDASLIAGTQVEFSAKIRGKGIQALNPDKKLPIQQGGKLMLVLQSASGRRLPRCGPNHGTFDWRDAVATAGVGRDLKSASVSIGMEGAVGTFWVSDICVRVVRAPVALPEPNATTRAAVANAKTEWRGVMSPEILARYNGPDADALLEEDFAKLGEWNVNLIRWQMGKAHLHEAGYHDWFDKQLAILTRALDVAARHGIKLVIDLHSKPGWVAENQTTRIFIEKKYADIFITVWEEISRRFKGHPALFAYDLINEPVQTVPSPEGVENWYDLQVRAARTVRAIDPKTPIIFSTDDYNNPPTYAWLKPVEDIPSLIYQTHFYHPHQYSHQFLNDDDADQDAWIDNSKFIKYPGGTVAGAKLDKERLRARLQPVRDFQLATGARIFIGEFSAIRWAPGAARYIDDCISIFEEYGWDWTYHAFRESHLWNVEYENLSPRAKPVLAPADKPTDRAQVLLKWLKLNKRPHPPAEGNSKSHPEP